MIAYCEQCGGRYEGQLLCPACGCKLRSETDMLRVVPKLEDADRREGPDFLGFFRRLFVGGLLSFVFYQALAHGSKSFATDTDSPQDVLVSLLSMAVFFATLITGMANHRAIVCGFLLGAVSAVVLLSSEALFGAAVPREWWIGLPVMQSLVGTVAGLLGRLMFLPAPRFDVPLRDETRLMPVKPKKTVPIKWLNVLLAVVVANVALVYADPIRDTLATTLGRGLGTYGSGRFIVWQITMIGTLLAGVLAGAGSKRGLRQGAIAGVFATVGLVTSAAKSGVAKIPAADFWIDQLNLEGATSSIYGVMATTMLVTMILGGWLGAHLFPPRRK